MKHCKSEQKPRRRGVIIFLRTFFIIVAVLAVLVGVVAAADAFAHSKARIVPTYARLDLTEVLAKEEWDGDDYALLYSQTGLTRQPLDSLKGNNAAILKFQDALFYDCELMHDTSIPFSSHDMTDFLAPLAPLRTGDVIVSSSVHTLGWQNGHAALITDGKNMLSVQAVAPGTITQVLDLQWFRQASNFMVLRPKNLTDEQLQAVADFAMNSMLGVKYSLFTGIFNAKNQTENPQTTHCAHVVWQAFMSAGFDVDSNGGAIVTARDIARSDLFEIVQVYGMDLENPW